MTGAGRTPGSEGGVSFGAGARPSLSSPAPHPPQASCSSPRLSPGPCRSPALRPHPWRPQTPGSPAGQEPGPWGSSGVVVVGPGMSLWTAGV